jgi:hypothetical protein
MPVVVFDFSNQFTQAVSMARGPHEKPMPSDL